MQRMLSKELEFANDLVTESFSILNSVASPCAIYDQMDRFLYANEAFRQEFDHKKIPYRWQQDRLAFVNNFQSYSFKDEAEALDAPANYEMYDPLTGNSHTFRWRSITTGSCKGFLLNTQCLTERRSRQQQVVSLQEKLMQTSRSMSVGEMATTIAHELNQPLGAILNYLQVGKMFLEKAGNHEKVLPAIDAAVQQAERATSVIARVREFVRRQEPKKEECHISGLMKSVLASLSLELKRQRVNITVDLDARLPSIYVDRIMVELVFANMVRNALDAMDTTPPSQRLLAIKGVVDVEGRLKVSISDTGCGIPDELAANLFQPFFTTKANGMGAGLSICRSILEFHGGHMYCEPNRPKGSTFICCIPANDQEAES